MILLNCQFLGSLNLFSGLFVPIPPPPPPRHHSASWKTRSWQDRNNWRQLNVECCQNVFHQTPTAFKWFFSPFRVHMLLCYCFYSLTSVVFLSHKSCLFFVFLFFFVINPTVCFLFPFSSDWRQREKETGSASVIGQKRQHPRPWLAALAWTGYTSSQTNLQIRSTQTSSLC